MKAAEFRQFQDIAYTKAGIRIAPGKEMLVSARVARRLRSLGLQSERDYLKVLSEDTEGAEIVQFLDAISTNFTSFFRENDHFIAFRKLVKNWRENGRHRFRFWCAASSSGEEPYSIVISTLEEFVNAEVDVLLLATDISTKVLDAASKGEYAEDRIAPVPKAQRLKYFQHYKNDRNENRYLVTDELRSRIRFRRLNLSKPPFPMSGPLDVIFCRNVMIYFDQTVRQRLISDCERLLAPDGVLFLGHSESLAGIQTGLRAIRPSVFCHDKQRAKIGALLS